jgi:hypothetical protein
MRQYTRNDFSACFADSRQRLEGLIDKLSAQGALELTHEQIESIVDTEGKDVLRLLFQGHLELRFLQEKRLESIQCPDGTRLSHVKVQQRGLRTIFGDVCVRRYSYNNRDEQTLSVQPADAVLNLPDTLYSHGLVRRSVDHAIKMSFDTARQQLQQNTGVHVPKRQLEKQIRFAAVDFDLFYQQRATVTEQHSEDLLVMSSDAKGVLMRFEDLRPDTRNRLYDEIQAAKKSKCKLAPIEHRKRMSTVAAVYSVPKQPREPEQIMGPQKPEQGTKKKQPRAKHKRVWASLMKEPEQVFDEVFREALKRDPQQKRQWVYLVDGDLSQLKRIEKKAKAYRVKITLICDFIHVLQYLWSAAHCFYPKDSEEAAAWLQDKALQILKGNCSYVAAAIRRKATLHRLAKHKRKGADDCARYLLNHKKYLRYDSYLADGFPIATGVIEGTCRHLVKDRLEITGARWSLYGAETILKLRALWASGDLDEYWDFHCQQHYERTHQYVIENLKYSEKQYKIAA